MLHNYFVCLEKQALKLFYLVMNVSLPNYQSLDIKFSFKILILLPGIELGHLKSQVLWTSETSLWLPSLFFKKSYIHSNCGPIPSPIKPFVMYSQMQKVPLKWVGSNNKSIWSRCHFKGSLRKRDGQMLWGSLPSNVLTYERDVSDLHKKAGKTSSVQDIKQRMYWVASGETWSTRSESQEEQCKEAVLSKEFLQLISIWEYPCRDFTSLSGWRLEGGVDKFHADQLCQSVKLSMVSPRAIGVFSLSYSDHQHWGKEEEVRLSTDKLPRGTLCVSVWCIPLSREHIQKLGTLPS